MTCRGFLLLVLALASPASAEPPGVPLRDAVPHMTTNGTASAEVMPDQADLTLGVRQERKTAEEATDAVARMASTLVETIKAQGIAPGDIHTSFRLSQTFDTKKDEKGNIVARTPRGYEAYERLVVRLHVLAKAGPLTRDLIAKGADGFEGMAFSYTKERQKRRELETEAMRDAFDQAKIYTDAVGLRLGRVLQIGDDPARADGAADMPSRRAPLVDAGFTLPVEPGLQRLDEAVTVIWEIEGRAR